MVFNIYCNWKRERVDINSTCSLQIVPVYLLVTSVGKVLNSKHLLKAPTLYLMSYVICPE